MITRLEVSNFRMLRGNAIDLKPFVILVGGNATGKTTLLDALQFVSDVANEGVRSAVSARTSNFYDLCFDDQKPIAFAIEMRFPRFPEASGTAQPDALFRYELEVGIRNQQRLRVLREQFWQIEDASLEIRAWPRVRPSTCDQPDLQVITGKAKSSWRRLAPDEEGRARVMRGGPRDALLGVSHAGNLARIEEKSEERDRHVLISLVVSELWSSIQTIVLDAHDMRAPSPPGSSTDLGLNGANLPHAVEALKKQHPERFQDWLHSVQLGVEGLVDVSVWERPEDRHRVLRASFAGGRDQQTPSYFLSDGTLRLMALAMMNFSAWSGESRAYLVEEPENGLHPQAIQAAYSVLSRMPDHVQVFCATHSPLFLAQATLDDVLVFDRTEHGSARVRWGREIPDLERWLEETDLADLLITGVLE